MDSPVLVVVPPTPKSPVGTRAKDPRLFQKNPESGVRTEGTSNSLDTISSSQASSASQPERSSSENTAVNIYSMYGGAGSETENGRDSYISNGTSDTLRRPSKSLPSSAEYPYIRNSFASSGRDSTRESIYETPIQSPTYPITPPASAPANGQMARPTVQTDPQQRHSAQGQYIEPGRISPAILIDPPPRRSSRYDHAHSKERLSPLSSPRPSSSSLTTARLSPTRISTDPSTSATSSSAQSTSMRALPSPLAPMAPSPAPNEDPDAYFVRATYAALDVSGVRGDGYEEGEELTRARLGSGRGNLPSPVPDTAKRMTMGGKELSEKEIELLGQLDRSV